MAELPLSLTVNGQDVQVQVSPRLTLADLLRDRLQLTGTHLGCEHGVCGACTVLVDGRSVRSCIMLAVQAQDRAVATVEGLTEGVDGELTTLQEAFAEEGALQCGFCTPGFLMSAMELLAEEHAPEEDTIREALSGNLCRCTGYDGIVRAVQCQPEVAAAPRSRWNDEGPIPGSDDPAAPPVGPKRGSWRAGSVTARGPRDPDAHRSASLGSARPRVRRLLRLTTIIGGIVVAVWWWRR